MEKTFTLERPAGTLRGTLHLPEGEGVHACLVLCHGLTGCSHERPLIAIARALAEKGVACVRPDCMGSGESDGESVNVTVRSEADDLLAVAQYVSGLPQIDAERIWLGGHSMGALAALAAAQERPTQGLVLLSPALSCYHEVIQGLTGAALADYQEKGYMDFGGFLIGRALVNELCALDGYALAQRLSAPLLLVHGELDGDSPVYHSVRLKELLGERATLKLIPGAHHCYESKPAQAMAAEAVAAYLARR